MSYIDALVLNGARAVIAKPEMMPTECSFHWSCCFGIVGSSHAARDRWCCQLGFSELHMCHLHCTL